MEIKRKHSYHFASFHQNVGNIVLIKDLKLNLNFFINFYFQINKMPYSDTQIKEAIEAKSKGMTYGQIHKEFGIPPATLCDYIKKRSTLGIKAGRKATFSYEVERKMVDAIISSSKMGFPMTKAMVLEKVGRLANRMDCQGQFVNGVPGK